MPVSAHAPRRRSRARCSITICSANNPPRPGPARTTAMTPLIRRAARFLTAHVDAPLLGAILLLLALGLVVIFSGSNQSLARVTTQAISMLVALGVMYAFANIPPHYLMRVAVPLYVLGVLLLVCVALFGDVVHGARRWLHVGVTRVQPSELMKIAVPLMLAWYFDRYEATLKLKN